MNSRRWTTMLPLPIALVLYGACATQSYEDVGTTADALVIDQDAGTIHFGDSGVWITHDNAWPLGGQPARLSIAQTTEYPTGNSSLQLGDNHHYFTTMAGQVVVMTTNASVYGTPQTSYFGIRGSDNMAFMAASVFEVSDSLVSDCALRLSPDWNGTSSVQFCSHVTQATVDVPGGVSLQVRSGSAVLTETSAAPDGGTSLSVRTGGSLKRVEVGDPGSCGTGYRCLRVVD